MPRLRTDRNPHLAWSDVPDGTRSFLLVCVDPDVPTVPETVGRTDMSVPATSPAVISCTG